jgi:hypothetical protein
VGDIQPIKISRALLGIRVGGYMKKRVDIILNNVELVQKQKLAPKGPFYLGKSGGGVLLSFDKIKVSPQKGESCREQKQGFAQHLHLLLLFVKLVVRGRNQP